MADLSEHRPPTDQDRERLLEAIRRRKESLPPPTSAPDPPFRGSEVVTELELLEHFTKQVPPLRPESALGLTCFGGGYMQLIERVPPGKKGTLAALPLLPFREAVEEFQLFARRHGSVVPHFGFVRPPSSRLLTPMASGVIRGRMDVIAGGFATWQPLLLQEEPDSAFVRWMREVLFPSLRYSESIPPEEARVIRLAVYGLMERYFPVARELGVCRRALLQADPDLKYVPGEWINDRVMDVFLRLYIPKFYQEGLWYRDADGLFMGSYQVLDDVRGEDPLPRDRSKRPKPADPAALDKRGETRPSPGKRRTKEGSEVSSLKHIDEAILQRLVVQRFLRDLLDWCEEKGLEYLAAYDHLFLDVERDKGANLTIEEAASKHKVKTHQVEHACAVTRQRAQFLLKAHGFDDRDLTSLAG